jgi:hypothetical protein
MREFIKIAFADATFQVPALVVAAHRAETLSKQAPSEYPSLEDALHGTAKLFDDEQEIINWAANNMTWADLQGQSMMLSSAEPNRSLKHALALQEWEFSDDPWEPAEPTGHADEIRLGLIVAGLIAGDSSCSFMAIGSPATYAVAVMVGEAAEISGYASGMQALAEMVARKRQGKTAVEEPSRILLPH